VGRGAFWSLVCKGGLTGRERWVLVSGLEQPAHTKHHTPQPPPPPPNNAPQVHSVLPQGAHRGGVHEDRQGGGDPQLLPPQLTADAAGAGAGAGCGLVWSGLNGVD